MSFHSNLSAIIPPAMIASKGNLSYISAATAVSRAARPKFNFIDFPDAKGKSQPFLELLGGAIVGVELEKAPNSGIYQTMYLPVMDRDNKAMDLKSITVADVNNSRQRCLVKAIAAVTGVGMSVFLGCDGDGAKAAKLLKVEPSSNLADIEAVVATHNDGGAPYIEWTYGLAAACTVDDQFRWHVAMYDGLPYREVLGSLQVDIITTFQGKSLTLGLPVMDAAFNPIPVDKATVFDWNKTMMRALTKCIAFNSGYGLEIYADDTEAKADAVARGARSPRNTKKADEKAKDAVKDPSAEQAASAAKAPAQAPAPEKENADAVQTAAPAAQEPAAEAASSPVAEAPAQAATVADPSVAKDTAQAAPAPEAVTKVADAPAPAADAATAAAPAASAASATATETPADPVSISKENQVQVDKFKEVMKKRNALNGVEGILSLFQALSVSTVFPEVAKPDCFSTLVMGAIFHIESEATKDAQAAYAHVPSLLEKFGEYGVAQMLRPDTRHLIALRLTALAFNAAVAKGDDASLAKASETLVSTGVAEDVADVFNLSQEADLSQETKDLLAAVLDAQAA